MFVMLNFAILVAFSTATIILQRVSFITPAVYAGDTSFGDLVDSTSLSTNENLSELTQQLAQFVDVSPIVVPVSAEQGEGVSFDLGGAIDTAQQQYFGNDFSSPTNTLPQEFETLKNRLFGNKKGSFESAAADKSTSVQGALANILNQDD